MDKHPVKPVKWLGFQFFCYPTNLIIVVAHFVSSWLIFLICIGPCPVLCLTLDIRDILVRYFMGTAIPEIEISFSLFLFFLLKLFS